MESTPHGVSLLRVPTGDLNQRQTLGQPPERRRCNDGKLYTLEEFIQFFGPARGRHHWEHRGLRNAAAKLVAAGGAPRQQCVLIKKKTGPDGKAWSHEEFLAKWGKTQGVLKWKQAQVVQEVLQMQPSPRHVLQQAGTGGAAKVDANREASNEVPWEIRDVDEAEESSEEGLEAEDVQAEEACHRESLVLLEVEAAREQHREVVEYLRAKMDWDARLFCYT